MPYTSNLCKHRKEAQIPLPKGTSLQLNKKIKKKIQQIEGNLLSYVCAFDPSMLHTLSSIALQLNQLTEQLWQ